MRQCTTKELYGYWSKLKGERAAPERSDLDLMRIRHVLSEVFTIEVDGNRSFPLRSCGTRLDALWLGERGEDSFLELWRESDRANLAAILLTVLDGASPVVAGVRTAAAGTDEALDLELLLLPLRHSGRTHSRVLGSLAMVNRPDWFGLAPIGPLILRSLRIIDESESRAILFSEHGLPLPPRPLSRKLRLVAERDSV